ncbi:MAG: glycoside hydrolase family 32 protein [Chloroflexi bacterium]|nr:glycoside hydrolase family 32 protein [Chloroflexota bacterium]
MPRTDLYRPQFHFTPQRDWMNDPNGLVHFDGEYHLFYQHNPYGVNWGHMHWGHAVSCDLVHWRDLPIALSEEPTNGITMFSGSAVVDWHNSSGFGSGVCPPLVVIYTAHHSSKPLENIHVAYSTDRGRTFVKYRLNPVLDVNHAKFGDPKVFWYAESNQWVMVTILGHEQGRVALYASTNLRDWRPLSSFEAADVAPAIWECPDLFALPLDGDPQQMRWILKVNNTDQNSPTQTWNFVGDFDGTCFQSSTLPTSAAGSDRGAMYAEVTYNDIPPVDGRRVLIGWIRQVPDNRRRWTGIQSIPRTLTLRSTAGGPRLHQAPVRELQALRGRHSALNNVPLPAPDDPSSAYALEGDTWEVDLRLDPADADECGLRLRLHGGDEAFVGFSATGAMLFLDQPGQPRLNVPMYSHDGNVRLHVFVDRSVIEVFGGEGEAVITATLQSDPLCATIQPAARRSNTTDRPNDSRHREAQLLHMDAWRMSSIWG